MLGALSAIAEATCRLLAGEGARLYLVGRDGARLDMVARDLSARGAADVKTRAVDLARGADADAELRSAAETLGGVDAVLIFYGSLGDQAQADASVAAARDILAVNFTSAAEWAMAGAELLEKSGAGVLLGISSVAGDRGRRTNYVYGAAKGGFSILLQGIAHRFAAKSGNLRAVAVKCGFVDTPMTAQFKKGGPLWATPAQIAAVVHRAMDGGGSIVYAPWFWRFIMLIIRALPQMVMHRTKL